MSDEVKRHPYLEPEGGWSRDDWQSNMLAAANYWLLRSREERGVITRAIFDLGGKVWRANRSGDFLAAHSNSQGRANDCNQ